jgi:hypothetical protein
LINKVPSLTKAYQVVDLAPEPKGPGVWDVERDTIEGVYNGEKAVEPIEGDPLPTPISLPDPFNVAILGGTLEVMLKTASIPFSPRESRISSTNGIAEAAFPDHPPMPWLTYSRPVSGIPPSFGTAREVKGGLAT